MSIDIIPAPPGYWLLTLQFETNEDDLEDMRGPLTLGEELVVGWEIRADQTAGVVLYSAGEPNGEIWDSALELPDGHCIETGNGVVHESRIAWMRHSHHAFDERDK